MPIIYFIMKNSSVFKQTAIKKALSYNSTHDLTSDSWILSCAPACSLLSHQVSRSLRKLHCTHVRHFELKSKYYLSIMIKVVLTSATPCKGTTGELLP